MISCLGTKSSNSMLVFSQILLSHAHSCDWAQTTAFTFPFMYSFHTFLLSTVYAIYMPGIDKNHSFLREYDEETKNLIQ